MPQCVEFQSGYLVQSQQDTASCTGYMLVTPQEFTTFQSVDIWSFEPVEAGKFFGFSFTLILICYLVAWGFGELLRFIR